MIIPATVIYHGVFGYILYYSVKQRHLLLIIGLIEAISGMDEVRSQTWYSVCI